MWHEWIKAFLGFSPGYSLPYLVPTVSLFLFFPSTQGPVMESQTGSLTDHPPATLTVPSMGEKEEVHYASLRFQRRQPRNAKVQQVTESEYSEINTQVRNGTDLALT